MTTNISDLIRRVTAIASLPHTAAEPMRAGHGPIVGSNGRVLGWAAAASGDYQAVAELWALAPTIIQALVQRNAELEQELAAREYLDHEAQIGADLVNAELKAKTTRIAELTQAAESARAMLRILDRDGFGSIAVGATLLALDKALGVPS